MQFNDENILNYIPTELFKYFPNLAYLNIYNASVTTLVEDSFNYCSNWNDINIQQNSISSVPARIASTCYFVQQLYLSYNKIQTIDENAFEGMESLSFLSLSYNEITCIAPLLFQHSLSLHSLDLNYNNIAAIHPATFKDLTLLCQIQLSENQIGYIPNFEFIHTCTAGMSQISMLMSNNPIQAIDPEFLTKYFYSRNSYMGSSIYISFYPNDPSNITTCVDPNIHPNNQMLFNIMAYEWVKFNTSMTRRTSCYSNWNAEMESNSLVTCGSVITPETTTTTAVTSTEYPFTSTTQSGSSSSSNARCYLDWNDRYTCVIRDVQLTITSITTTHIDGFGNDDVTRVYFKNSWLSIVPGIIFDTFPNLDFLSIANCGLNIITDQTFNKCGKLEFLDASNNHIIHVEETSLRNCTSLVSIDLSGNPVDSLGAQLYHLDPVLKKIHLNKEEGLELA